MLFIVPSALLTAGFTFDFRQKSVIFVFKDTDTIEDRKCSLRNHIGSLENSFILGDCLTFTITVNQVLKITCPIAIAYGNVVRAIISLSCEQPSALDPGNSNS